MAEQFRVQISLDENSRNRLRQLTGQGTTSVAFMLGRLIETGLAERKRLLSGILRRMELAQRGALVDSDRAGMVPVPLSPKLGLQLGELGGALDHTAGGMAGLIIKVVLDDPAWTLTTFTDMMTDVGKVK
jgi:hypothetical protein